MSHTTEYEPVLKRCSCSCGWFQYVLTDREGDRLISEHTDEHWNRPIPGVTA